MNPGVPATVNLVMAATVGGLYSVGFYLLLQRSLMRVLIGVVVLGHGTNLLLQLVGGPPGRAPIVGQFPIETFADPLPQALALTAVVITFALTTFLLALGYRSFTLIGQALDWTTLEAFLPITADPQYRKSALASSFVAALELARQGRLELDQREPFAELLVRNAA